MNTLKISTQTPMSKASPDMTVSTVRCSTGKSTGRSRGSKNSLSNVLLPPLDQKYLESPLILSGRDSNAFDGTKRCALLPSRTRQRLVRSSEGVRNVHRSRTNLRLSAAVLSKSNLFRDSTDNSSQKLISRKKSYEAELKTTADWSNSRRVFRKSKSMWDESPNNLVTPNKHSGFGMKSRTNTNIQLVVTSPTDNKEANPQSLPLRNIKSAQFPSRQHSDPLAKIKNPERPMSSLPSLKPLISSNELQSTSVKLSARLKPVRRRKTEYDVKKQKDSPSPVITVSKTKSNLENINKIKVNKTGVCESILSAIGSENIQNNHNVLRVQNNLELENSTVFIDIEKHQNILNQDGQGEGHFLYEINDDQVNKWDTENTARSKKETNHNKMYSSTVVGNWIKTKLIGRGTGGKVYLGYNPDKESIFAVKIVKCESETNIEDIQNEIKSLEALNHPNIVSYFGHEEVKPRTFHIFMEYLVGGSISSVLKTYGQFSIDLSRVFLSQVALGMEFLHAQKPPILHRDLKGANILIADDGSVKISDFGCAAVGQEIQKDELLHSIQNDTTIFALKSFKGSVPWMSPECMINEYYTVLCDVWSFACFGIEMISGEIPWANESFDNPLAAMYFISNSPKSPLSSFEEGLDDVDGFWKGNEELRELLDSCVQRRPSLRPSFHNIVKRIRVNG